MAQILRLIPPSDAEALLYIYNGQSGGFKSMCDVPRLHAARAQSLLPRALTSLRIFLADDTAQCAYAGSVIDSAAVRADGRDHSPTADAVYESIRHMVYDLHPSFVVPTDGVLYTRDPLLPTELTLSTQNMLSQAELHCRPRGTLSEEDFRERF